MFLSEASASGHLESIQHLNAPIGEAGGARFWFHALRNCSITVADRELKLPTSLNKRLVNHAPSQDITEGYAAASVHNPAAVNSFYFGRKSITGSNITINTDSTRSYSEFFKVCHQTECRFFL